MTDAHKRRLTTTELRRVLAGHQGAEAQGRQVFANIEVLLAAVGGEPRHLVKLLTLVGGTEHLAGYRAAQAEAFGRWFPDGDFPAQSLAVMAALAAPEYVVEVEAAAAVPARFLQIAKQKHRGK